MDDLNWPRVLNKVITKKWSALKNTLVMKDFVDHLIQKRVVTLDYWMGLKAKQITESERTEDFLALLMKYDQQKYNYFLESLLAINREDLVKELVKAQNIKPRSSKDRQRSNSTPGSHGNPQGQTDADQLPQSISKSNSVDGKARTDKAKQKPLTNPVKDKDQLDKQNKEEIGISSVRSADSGYSMSTGEVTARDEVSGSSSTTTTGTIGDNLHLGTETVANKQEQSHSKGGEKTTKTESIKVPHNKDADKSLKSPDEKVPRDQVHDIGNQSREEILNLKELRLKNKESELNEKEQKLKIHEESLKQKESDILIREKSVLSFTQKAELGLLPKQLADLQAESFTPSSTYTTQSSDILTDVREQLAAMRKVKHEIESEHTTSCNTPKDEYVRMEEFQTVQQDIEELRDEIATDRTSRETIQQKVEDLKDEIENLQRRIKELEVQKEDTRVAYAREMNKHKSEISNIKSNNNESINSIKMEMKSKQKECDAMKTCTENLTKHSEKLEQRVDKLEQDKERYEKELLRYEREVSDLRKALEKKEKELNDLRKVLEDTVNEKDDLEEELSSLKTEVSRLKADKKRLEQEKKTLLGRCVKPQWTSSTSRRPSFQ